MSLETLAQWSQIAGAVIFVILAVVLWNKYLSPAVKSYTASRNAELQQTEERRERLKREADEAVAAVAAAERDASEIRGRVDGEAGRDRAKALAEADAEAARIVRNAEGELERARLAARDRLRIEFIEKALARAREEAPRRISGAVDEKLVESTVADLTRGTI